MRILIILPIFVLTLSCSDSALKQQLVGTWRYDMEASLQEMESQGASQSDLNYMQSILIGLQDATLSFSSNGEANFQISDIQEKGNWEIDKKQSMLILELDGNEQRSILSFKNPDTLLLIPPSEEEGFLRVLINQ